MIINCRYLTQNLTGVQRFGFEITKRLTDDANTIRVAPGAALTNKAYDLPTNFKVTRFGNKGGHLWEQLELRKYLKANGSPLLLNLGNTAPLYYKNQILTIHDLAFLHAGWHSAMFRNFYKLLIPQLLKSCIHVITVSNFSKSEIIKHYNVAEDKISVVYNAPYNQSVANNSQADPLTTDRYILAVGSMDPRKNLKTLVKAFNDVEDKELNLYLVGAKNKNYSSDKELFALIESNKRIKFLGYQTDADLNWYYEHAVCFVFPSFYEGFGLPPIEAMVKGCPAIVSDQASLPEVCGDASLYFDPHNVGDLSEKLNYFLANPQVGEQMKIAGLKQAAKYSWAGSGQAVKAIINRFS